MNTPRNLEHLEQAITATIRGQNEAVTEFANAVRLGWNGVPRPGRTRGFVILLGPTGTGKTEMTLIAVRELFGAEGAETNFARFDMAEYHHPDAIRKFIGGGGEIPLLGRAIDKLNAAGGGILLLDEIEKADANLVRALLSFDAARITMNDGVTKDLSNIFVVLTSNLGSADAAQMRSTPYATLKKHILRVAEECFNAEGMARFSAKIVTNRLPYEVQREIATAITRREIRLQSQYLQREIVTEGDEVMRFLVRKGFTPELGARTIRSAVEQHIGHALLPYVHESLDTESMPGDRLSRRLVLEIVDDTLRATPVARSLEFTELLAASSPALLKAS